MSSRDGQPDGGWLGEAVSAAVSVMVVEDEGGVSRITWSAQGGRTVPTQVPKPTRYPSPWQ